MYSREMVPFWNKLKKEAILCLQIRQAVAGGRQFNRRKHCEMVGLPQLWENAEVFS